MNEFGVVLDETLIETIEDLKNRLEDAVADCSLRLQENEKLQQRIDRAINFIENYIIATETEDILLKILKGDFDV